jgi:hypothetical protein
MRQDPYNSVGAQKARDIEFRRLQRREAKREKAAAPYWEFHARMRFSVILLDLSEMDCNDSTPRSEGLWRTSTLR